MPLLRLSQGALKSFPSETVKPSASDCSVPAITWEKWESLINQFEVQVPGRLVI